MPMMLPLVVALLVAPCVLAQSNYASQANSIEFKNEGLPDSTVLDGKVTKLDDLSPVIFLNRTKAALNCASGYMQIELKFDEPFYGIAYADFDRASACQVSGRGDKTAKIDLPLKGCGTVQDPQRVFTNNIVVRFHPALEMEGDEVITIVCRYPPPIAPPPAGMPEYIQELPAPALPLAPPLRGFQILLIICGILFLSLVLLGLGCSYYMLRRKRVQVIRRHPLSTGTGSEITKLSDSSLGHISMFENVKIPRAHAQTGSSSGSEAALISDTLPSDYPSESPSSAHSEVEDVDTRSLRRSSSSGASYENKGYVQDSFYTETTGHTIETEMRHALPKRPPPEPKFDVQVRVKKAALPPPTPTPPPSESEASMMMAERNLTTILEEARSMPKPIKTTFSYIPEIHAPPASKIPTPPPVYSTVRKQQHVDKTVTEELYSREDRVDYEARAKMSPPPPVTPMYSRLEGNEETTVEIVEPPLIVSRRPELKSHVVDDVFLRTITEKKTIEDIERHKRQITEFRKAQPPPKWDVTIKNYPLPEDSQRDDSVTDWDSYSENSSVADYRPHGVYRTQNIHTQRTDIETENIYRHVLETPVQERPKQNWDVMVRVLEPPQYESTDDRSDVESIASALTIEDRKKWKEIITTESTLRTMLTEATLREDYERIRRDQRYEKLFEPQKWDVIIRVLAPPADRPQYDQRGAGGSNKYRRKADWDTRSRRSSLPTLYEYDSDGGSSVRTLTTDGHGVPSVTDPLRSRRTSRSSMRSEMDVRSMSEVTVDMRAHILDNFSDVSSYYPRRYYDSDDDDNRSLVRSLSQPSLARSASEFTEHWAVRSRHWESPEHSPRSSRSARTKAMRLTQTRYEKSSSSNWFGDADSEASFK
ncbi:uncharacterized protein LOC106667600 [Cimex lectularius]|uniref:ZP domain-containing protein n=1 Tax=Cimex lectularius TaxID=79782 RepID=A0A8I6TF23_CIMLE|nr:uncharacterized protein LOC106667600 [Cimex lectularius]